MHYDDLKLLFERLWNIEVLLQRLVDAAWGVPTPTEGEADDVHGATAEEGTADTVAASDTGS